MPKILMLITNFGKGGAQRVFFDHSLAFSKENEVEEAVFDISEDERLYNTQLPVHDLQQGASSIPGPIGRMLKRARNLKKLVSKKQFDLVISHMDGANWLNVLSGNRAKKILVVHGTILHDNDQSIMKQWMRKNVLIPYLYNRADMTVSVSEGIAEELRTKCGVKKVMAIPNFFDIEEINAKAALPIPDLYEPLFSDFQVLITSGRFADQKKQLALIPIFSEVKKTNPEAKLVLLGDGPLREDLLTAARANGLCIFETWTGKSVFDVSNDIFFLGYIDNPYQYLSRSTLFLFPSAWEGFPMALCEAMICGVAVLSADCPTGPREILAPGTTDIAYSLTKAEFTDYGVLLPMVEKENHLTAWVGAVDQLLHTPAEMSRYNTNARQRMNNYSRQHVFKLWRSLIDGII